MPSPYMELFSWNLKVSYHAMKYNVAWLSKKQDKNMKPTYMKYQNWKED